MANSITETIGCDLGDKYIEICLSGTKMAAGRLRRIRTAERAVTAFFTRAPGTRGA